MGVQGRGKGESKEDAEMKYILICLILVGFSGCASFRARVWAELSDRADELDGTDDVPSVTFEGEE